MNFFVYEFHQYFPFSSYFQLTLFVGVALSAPQGYDYNIVNSIANSEFTQEQYQLLQQLTQQEAPQTQQYQQQQVPVQQQQTVAIHEGATQIASPAGDYQYANQLVQQAHQLVQFEQQQQQAVKPAEIAPIAPAPVYEPQQQQQPQYQQQFNNQQETAAVAPTQSVEYNKEFYYLSAPQDDYETPQDLQQTMASLKKNIRVVFIKAPENNGLANAAAQLVNKHAQDSQTAIYVLTKQHTVSDLANGLKNANIKSSSKPEVVFVKYRTPQEAEEAQRTIQAQYEALDGPNTFSYKGVAKSHDFVSKPKQVVDPRNSKSSESVAATPDSQYLPAVAKH